MVVAPTRFLCQTVNFYALEKSSVNAVDLPGYGFAFANEENQKQWQDTVSVCFKSHPRLVFVATLQLIPN